MRRLLWIALMLAPACVWAQPYDNTSCTPNCYVSTTGSDATGTGTQALPWASLQKAFCEAQPGDTIWYEDGTYEAPLCSSKFLSGDPCTNEYGWWIDPGRDAADEYSCTQQPGCGSAGGDVTIRSINGADSVIFTQSTPAATCHDHMVVGVGCDYVTFQGITWQTGRNRFEPGSTDITFTENIFKCPGTEDGSNCSVIMSGTNENTSNTGWLVEDNLFLADSSCNATCSATAYNFTKIYSQTGVWRNNDYIVKATYDPPGGETGMEWSAGFKGSNENVEFYNNYIRSFKSGGIEQAIVVNASGFGAAGNAQVHNNIVHNALTCVQQQELDVEKDDFYNNTCYDVFTCYKSAHSVGDLHIDTEWFNNVCVLTDTSAYGSWVDDGSSGQGVEDQSYWNNNLYYDQSGTTGGLHRNSGTEVNSLANWQTHLGTTLGLGASLNENASQSADPLLTDPASGDYTLQGGSPALTGGRGGAFATVLGAYITGSEVIGCSFHEECFSYGGEAPATSESNAVQGVILQGVTIQ